MPGTLFVVATPIGNLEDISVRALNILRKVSLIAAEDTRRTAKLLGHYGIATPTTSLHEHNERQKSPSLIERLLRGEDIAVVSDAGTPTVSDPGRLFVRSVARQGIKVEAIPGASAITTALAASGFSSDDFLFLGFPPPKGAERTAWFGHFLSNDRTVVFFESPHRIACTLEDLLKNSGDHEVVVARELTKAHEELVRGPISAILTQGLRAQGEFTVVVEPLERPRAPATLPSDANLLNEFRQLSETWSGTRRQLIGDMANKYRVSAKTLYASLERARKLVE